MTLLIVVLLLVAFVSSSVNNVAICIVRFTNAGCTLSVLDSALQAKDEYAYDTTREVDVSKFVTQRHTCKPSTLVLSCNVSASLTVTTKNSNGIQFFKFSSSMRNNVQLNLLICFNLIYLLLNLILFMYEAL